MDNARLEKVKKLIKEHEGAEFVDNDPSSVCVSLSDVRRKESFLSAMKTMGWEVIGEYENGDFNFEDSTSPEGQKAIDKDKRTQEGLYEEENELGSIKIDKDFITCQFKTLRIKGLRKVPMDSIKAYTRYLVALPGNRCGDCYDFIDSNGQVLASCMAECTALAKIMRLRGIKKIKGKMPLWVDIGMKGLVVLLVVVVLFMQLYNRAAH